MTAKRRAKIIMRQRDRVDANLPDGNFMVHPPHRSKRVEHELNVLACKELRRMTAPVLSVSVDRLKGRMFRM